MLLHILLISLLFLDDHNFAGILYHFQSHMFFVDIPMPLLIKNITAKLDLPSATIIHTSCTGSRLISEVNLVLACLVLGWVTTWE